VGLLEANTMDARDPALRSRALAALFATEVPASRLGPTLERVLADGSAPDALRKVAKAYIASH